MSRNHIGIAIGERGLTAIVRVRDAVHRADEPLAPGAHEDAGALTAALLAAAAKLEVLVGAALDGERAHVALLPPLADARLVQLPPLRHAEAEAVLRRDAARHFVGGAAARVVAAAPPPARPRGEAGVPATFAAAASLGVVEAVRRAVVAAGWRPHAVVPAQAAWLAALPASPRPADAAAEVVIAVHGDAAHVIRRDGGIVAAVRRVPPVWRDALVAAAGAGPGTAIVLADAALREPLARALRSAGWSVADAALPDAAGAAAAYAHAAGLTLVSPLQAAARRDRQRTIGLRIAAAAVLLLAGAAAVELWGTERELEAVRARRAELRDAVTPLLATRDSLARLEERVATIRALDTDAPRWTRAVFDLALLLPPDARLTRLTTSGDTLYVEAAGARAGAALQALRSASSLYDVRLDGTVLRDLEGGETVVERFRVRARLTDQESWTPPAQRPVGEGASAPPAQDRSAARGEGRTEEAEAAAAERTRVRRSM